MKDQPVVRGLGPVTTDRVLAGEAPSHQEVVEGRPFVGPAGVRLTNELTSARVDRRALYITNALLCQLPSKLTKTEKSKLLKSAVPACHERLVAEIRMRMPHKVMALGGTAALALTGSRKPIEELRLLRPLPPLDLDRYSEVRVTYHPSSLPRNRNWLAWFREDIKWLRDC